MRISIVTALAYSANVYVYVYNDDNESSEVGYDPSAL